MLTLKRPPLAPGRQVKSWEIILVNQIHHLNGVTTPINARNQFKVEQKYCFLFINSILHDRQNIVLEV